MTGGGVHILILGLKYYYDGLFFSVLKYSFNLIKRDEGVKFNLKFLKSCRINILSNPRAEFNSTEFKQFPEGVVNERSEEPSFYKKKALNSFLIITLPVKQNNVYFYSWIFYEYSINYRSDEKLKLNNNWL